LLPSFSRLEEFTAGLGESCFQLWDPESGLQDLADIVVCFATFSFGLLSQLFVVDLLEVLGVYCFREVDQHSVEAVLVVCGLFGLCCF
jgi:hypothetical protein